jgi:hypothetical protein
VGSSAISREIVRARRLQEDEAAAETIEAASTAEVRVTFRETVLKEVQENNNRLKTKRPIRY